MTWAELRNQIILLICSRKAAKLAKLEILTLDSWRLCAFAPLREI
jgi:hypothetical protein